MKIAVLSDVHANPAALETVLKDAREQGCERFICLGDIVGYGYDPNSCIEMCRANGIECILGNHDAGMVGKLSLQWFNENAARGVLRHRNEVSEEDKEWIRGLPYSRKEDFGVWRTCFAHGSFTSPEEFDYINSYMDAARELAFMKMRNCDILFVGHTHYAEAWAQDMDERISSYDTYNAPDLSINLNNYAQIIINVGSVGYPRNQDATYYVIFDTDEQMVHYRKLPFDFDEYLSKMESANISIPRWLEPKKGKTR